MAFLFSFLGFCVGLFLGYRLDDIFPFIPVLIFGLICLYPAKRRGYLKFDLFFLLIGFLIALIFFLLYLFLGDYKGDYYGVVIEARKNYFVFFSNGAKYYVYEKDCQREVGDFLKIYGSSKDYSGTIYESRFDFGEYLYAKGVYKQLSSYNIESLFKMPIRWREWQNSFLSNFDSETSSLLDSILFSRKDYDSEIISLADSMALLNVFSYSGIFYQLILRGFRRVASAKFEEDKCLYLSIIPATILLPFSLNKIGIWRVYVSLLLKVLLPLLFKKRKFSYLEITCLSGFILIAINPHNAYQTGFLLGYGISLIIYFSRSLFVLYSKPKQAVLIYILVYLLILPINLSGGEYHLMYPIYSKILLPFLAVYMLIGFLFYFFFIPGYSLLNGYTYFLKDMLSLFKGMDISFPIPILNGWTIYLYYLCFLFGLLFYDMGLRRERDFLIFSFLATFLFSMVPIMPSFTSSVYFINVGQGDSILIQDRGTAIMIDTGGNISFDMAEEVLIPFLRKKDIYKIDALFITHDDYDHSGAKESLCSSYQVNNVYTYDDSFPIRVGNLTFNNLNIYDATEENDKSLVLSLEFMDKSWLFMGDAPESIEKKIIKDNPDLDCDILKVGHHGSDTSSCLSFLKQVTPSEAIISCGKNNSYGHPRESVLKNLSYVGANIRRTDLEGSIEFTNFALPFV